MSKNTEVTCDEKKKKDSGWYFDCCRGIRRSGIFVPDFLDDKEFFHGLGGAVSDTACNLAQDGYDEKLR